MKFAIDYLGGARYGDIILKAHPKDFGAGFFSFVDGFGSSLPVARKLASTNRCPFIRFHLWWRDNHNFNGYEDEIINQAEDVRKLVKDFPKIQFEVSPACEHLWRKEKADLVCANVEKIFKGLSNVEVINTPYLGGGGQLSSKYKNEVHRADNQVPRQGRFNFSYDGRSAVDSPVSKDKRRWQKAEWFFFWTYQLNLKRNEKDRTPRKDRKAKPTKELIESLAYLATEKGRTFIEKGWLLKSHAEQIGDTPTARENKVLVLAPIKASKCELITEDGKVVARAPYYGSFEKLHRYYFEVWGYKLPKRVRVVINGKSYGIVNPGFREGYFR
jgi:hypothetical protein